MLVTKKEPLDLVTNKVSLDMVTNKVPLDLVTNKAPLDLATNKVPLDANMMVPKVQKRWSIEDAVAKVSFPIHIFSPPYFFPSIFFPLHIFSSPYYNIFLLILL